MTKHTTDASWIGDCTKCGHNANDHDLRAYRLGGYKCLLEECDCSKFGFPQDKEDEEE